MPNNKNITEVQIWVSDFLFVPLVPLVMLIHGGNEKGTGKTHTWIKLPPPVNVSNYLLLL